MYFLKKGVTYLQQPYPYYWSQLGLVRVFLTIALFSFVFMYAFQPFVVYEPEHRMDYLWICVIHALVPGLVGYLYVSFVNWCGVKEENWNIGKEFLQISILLLFMGIGSFLVRDIVYDNPLNWSFRYFYEEIRNTFMVGILLMLIFIPLNFNRLFRKYEQEAALLQSDASAVHAVMDETPLVAIRTQVKADDFQLAVHHMLFAKASGNYTEIYLSSNGGVEILLKRISIKELEQQLASVVHIVKTHRAYLVNTRMIKRVKGNAQGYRLSFDDTADTVPVARGMIGAFNQAIGYAHTFPTGTA